MDVCVLGAGTMGHGIAQVSALAGHDVALRDVERDIVEEGLDAIESNLQGGVEREKVSREAADVALERIRGTTDLAAAAKGAELLVEAVPENEELKREVLADAEEHLAGDAIVASNTSSLSVTAIMSALDRPDRGIGLHFFNPVYIMDLVEVVVGERTAAETRSFATEFVDGLDKTAIVVEDHPGFATSRLGVIQGLEAMRMVQEGVASAPDIDTGMELGYNHPMGPLELTDVVGLDVRLDILDGLREELGERFRPPAILRRKVRAGNLGKKTGEGFYIWEDGEPVEASDDV